MKSSPVTTSKQGDDGSTTKPPEAREREREGPTPRVSSALSVAAPTNGVVQFHVSVRVDMAEFAGWEAERISAFFAGIAQVLAAKGSSKEDED
jgi:hypothetical protein